MTTERQKQVNSIENLMKTIKQCGKVDASELYLSRVWHNDGLSNFNEFKKHMKKNYNVIMKKREDLATKLRRCSSSYVDMYTLIQEK